ncbi:MAG TPA: dihydropteroate synthase [Longimicrobiaceae bacterium]|nr:dihydropteroate synthase [Longimicrobiaceae bacterium]
MGSVPFPGLWSIRGRSLSLERPLVMGVLNVTPDSFSDGGRFSDPARALERAVEMVEEGADLLDVGGESTRPGAAPVESRAEMERVLPVVRLLKARLPVPVSVDTRRAEVARAALAEGAEIVNDVSALADPEMGGVVAESGAGVVLMHMRGTPQTMQLDPRYGDVAGEVADELSVAVERARAAGIPDGRITIDPGIGFAKTAEHNLELIARLGELTRLGFPVLFGPSRKAFIGKILGGIPAEERGAGTAAACVVGLLHGARIFRVHDVRTVRHALDVAEAIRRALPTPAAAQAP